MAVPGVSTHEGLRSSAVRYRPCGEWLALSDDQRAEIIERGRKVVAGSYQAYGAEWRPLPSTPEAWHRHPQTSVELPMTEWWRVPLMRAGVDVKDVWEPGRFAWVYDLIRAYAITGEDAFAAAFHRWFAGWYEANPPFRGPQ